ncbi:MAG: HoxN/HupN/NixA family nickel/cobalt transporter [Rhodopila sp.]
MSAVGEGTGSGAAELSGRILGLYASLITVTIVVWGIALLAAHTHPVLLGTALLAYTFGLRHAVDADHIAAIDNVTRKLMQQGQRPVSVGLYFSLGHSTVVFLASIGIAIVASAMEGRFQALKSIGSLVGTLVSAGFLFAIAFANIIVLIGIWRSFQRVGQGGGFIEEDLDRLLANRGGLNRLFRSIFRLIGKSWHMYPLGVLFGLGFDTATEIGVLAMSAMGAAQGLPIWAILIFPALFTAGMTLIDTTDSILMLGAYGWAFVKPIRKLYYNLTITFVSVVIAFVVGAIEVLGIVGERFGFCNGIWRAIAGLNDDFGTLGYLVIGIFVLSWVMSGLIYRLKGYDRIEVTDP